MRAEATISAMLLKAPGERFSSVKLRGQLRNRTRCEAKVQCHWHPTYEGFLPQHLVDPTPSPPSLRGKKTKKVSPIIFLRIYGVEYHSSNMRVVCFNNGVIIDRSFVCRGSQKIQSTRSYGYTLTALAPRGQERLSYVASVRFQVAYTSNSIKTVLAYYF